MSAALLRVAPTAVLVRRYRAASAGEREIGGRLRAMRERGDGRTDAYWRLVDEYDQVGDRAAMAGMELRRRGVATCSYCGTVPPEPHWSDGCPELLAARMGL